jgi:hypothetical protein
MRSPTAMGDFWSLSPESLHQVTILMSDRGLPTDVRHINGYGSHTHSFINAKNERFWVKFHFKTLQGHKHWTNAEAETVVGKTRESTQADLFGAIERKDYPRWRFCVQIMPETDADKTLYNPFDLTKVWPHGAYPLIEVGVTELNRNPDNYFAEIEQAASARPTSCRASASRRTRCCRRASSPTPMPASARHALRGAAGQCAKMPGSSLSQGRRDAVLRQQSHPGRLLRAQLVAVDRSSGRTWPSHP